MSDPAERFIEAAVRPLADNAELEILARSELHEVLSQHPDVPAASLGESAARLEKSEKLRPWPAWKLALYVVTAVVSVAAFNVVGRSYNVIRELSGQFGSSFATTASPSRTKSGNAFARGLSPEQRLLLEGDTSHSLKSDRMKALWNSDPGNAAYFAEYAIYYRQDHERLPADFLDTARRLDPDNAWFTLMEASVNAKGSVERGKLTPKEKKDEVLPSYRVLDEARLQQVIERIREAGAQPRFDSYQGRLLKQRIPLLPKRTDFVSQALPLTYLASVPADTITFRHLMDAMDARCAEWAATGDEKSFRELAASWESCLTRWSETESISLIDSLVLKVCVHATARRFEDCAKRFGMTPEAERWGAIAKQLKEEREAKKQLPQDSSLKLRGGVFSGLTLPNLSSHSANAPRVTAEDLKPGRLADHEFFSRAFSPLVWLALLMGTALVVGYRSRASRLTRQLAQRFEALFRPVDWLWILGGGIVLPFLLYQGIYRLTSWGGRDWSIVASNFIVPAGQFNAAGFLMIMMPVLIARWRMGKRGEMLGFRTRTSWFGWTAVILGTLSIPVFGLAFMSGGKSEATMITAGIMLGILQLACVIAGVRATFGPKRHLLRRVTLTRLLAPAYASGMLLILAVTPLYQAAERHWITQDRLMEITPDAPSINRYEYEVAKAVRNDLRELLKR